MLGCLSLVAGIGMFCAVEMPLYAEAAPTGKALDRHTPGRVRAIVPAEVRASRRFLARRGVNFQQRWRHGVALPSTTMRLPRADLKAGYSPAAGSSAPVWSAAGPLGILTPSFGLVSGRLSAVAFDPSDASSNHLFLGTTGGGLWRSQNAAASTASSVQFLPVTDGIAALSGVAEAGLSVGAVSVQPGGTGVVLAGLGDPNDALDSYYGAGLLRSTDSGNTWTLVQHSIDLETGQGTQDYWFTGEGFAGFAWSTSSVQTVVAAVSQAYEGTVVDAAEAGQSYEGLYYSQDAGVTWHLSQITDLNGQDIQGPLDPFALPDGNAATSLVWNPVRQLFVAAVRYHGFYSSPDGVVWTQMNAQPGSGFTAMDCPTEPGSVGVAGCPIFRGTLAVNPLTGDTFAWSVDAFNQDQGIWQDQCALSGSISGGVCSNPTITFGVQLNTAALEISDENGAVTIPNGDYNLSLAAVPAALAQGEDTLLFAGGNDVWKCSLANSCPWRNTTNSTTCFSAGVGEYQHAIAWSPNNPNLLFFGNDSGLWRSSDQVGETGGGCSSSDASHFQNLNASIGSLAEVDSLAQSKSTAATQLAGVGANGVAGVVNAVAAPTSWNQVVSGEGGPVAIDPSVGGNSWYANNGAGVSIVHCSSTTACTPAGFGTSAVIGEAQVENDGLTMPYPATFRLDLEDPTQAIVGTCRVWRGPLSGLGWSSANAISPTLDGIVSPAGNDCDGNALIRSMAVAKYAATSAGPAGELIYAGMAGAVDGGEIVAGHLFSATVSATGTASAWTDVTYSPVTNDQLVFNAFGLDVSSIYVDPHDSTGMTVYATISGFASSNAPSQAVYWSTSGGASWTAITGNLPNAPANAIAVDAQDPNTVYVGLDTGVYVTRAVSTCPTTACWASYGTGLPGAPVTELLVDAPGAAGPDGGQALTAATYGRGIWQIPMATAGTLITSASVSPSGLNFGNSTVGVPSAAQTITLKNTGTNGLTVVGITFGGAAAADYAESDGCVNTPLTQSATCTIKVVFTPTAIGSRIAALQIAANVSGGQILLALAGVGLGTANVTLLPTSLAFGTVEVGFNSTMQGVSVQNIGGSTVTLNSIVVSAPFAKGTVTCGGSIGADAACAVNVYFAPKSAGAATGSLTVTDGVGTQTAILIGTGIAAPTDTLSASVLSFPATVLGQSATPMAVTLTNSGGLPLTQIGISVTAGSGTGASDFTAVGNCGSQLAPNASCAFTVSFSPTVARSESATLVVSDALHAQQIGLSGVGLKPPLIALSSGNLTFGSIQVSTSSAVKLLTVYNNGGSPLTLPGFSISGTGAQSFSVSDSIGMTACGKSVPANANCQLQVIFTPLATGAATATLVVTTSAPGVASASTMLNGTGLSPPILEVLPPSLVFGPVVLGFSSGLFNVQIINIGQEPMALPTFAVTGPQAADFVLSPPTDITACTVILNPGNICNIQITFSPTILGAEFATLTVTSSNAIPPTATVSLTGTGMPVILLQADPASVSFPATIDGQSSVPLTVAVSNLGKKKANNLSFTFGGPYQLSPLQTTCGTALAGGAFCTVGIIFSPTVAGDEPGSLTIGVTNAGALPLVIPLDGSGVAVGGILPSPTQMTFGSVVVQTASLPQTLTVTNSGQAAIVGLTLSTNGDFGLTANQCPSILGAPVCSGSTCVAQSCTTGVVFTPSQTGNRIGSLTISSTSAGVLPGVVSLTGSGNPESSLSLTPAVTSFGGVTVGLTSAAQMVTVTNASGIGASNLTGVQFVLAGDFGLSQNTCGNQVAMGATCTFAVNFSPSQAGTRIGSVTVTSTTSGFIPVVEGLAGLGLSAAQLVVTPAQLQFGQVAVGSNSVAQNLTLSNPGRAPLQSLSIMAAPPFNAGTGSCNTTIAAGANCNIPVIFAPASSGTVSGVITISTGNIGVMKVSEPVSGTGIKPATLTLSPRTLSYAATPVGGSTLGQSILITNSGQLTVGGLTVVIQSGSGGATSADFTIDSSSCSSTLAGNATCSVLASFNPIGAGGRTAFLTAASTTAGVASESTSLSGIGLTPGQILVYPTGIDFSPTLIGTTSATKTISVLNSGQSAINDLTISDSELSAAGGFYLNSAVTTCTAHLAPGSRCVAGVQFSPVAGGLATGTLTFNSAQSTAEGSAPATVALNGIGALPPAIVPSQPVAVFGLTGIHIAAVPISLRITNQGSLSSLTGLTLAINATGIAAGFGLSGNDCNSSLGPSASCATYITFAPTGIANLNGTLTIKSANSASQTVALSGAGFDFTMSLIGSGSIAVIEGQTANYSIAITPLAGVTGALGGPFSFRCSSLPSNALCLFNPPQLASLPANVSGDITAAIGTGGGLSTITGGGRTANALKHDSSNAESGRSLDRAMFILSGILLVPIVVARRKHANGLRHRPYVQVFLFLLALTLVVSGVSSCASASQSGGQLHGTGGTPPGTYTVQVTATSTGVQHNIALKLIVN